MNLLLFNPVFYQMVLPDPVRSGIVNITCLILLQFSILLCLIGYKHKTWPFSGLMASYGCLFLETAMAQAHTANTIPVVWQFVILYTLGFLMSLCWSLLFKAADEFKLTQPLPDRFMVLTSSLIGVASAAFSLIQLGIRPAIIAIVLFPVWMAGMIIQSYSIQLKHTYPTYTQLAQPETHKSDVLKSITFYITLYFSLMYLLWRILFTLPSDTWTFTFILAVTLLVCESLDVVDCMMNSKIMAGKKSYPVPVISPPPKHKHGLI